MAALFLGVASVVSMQAAEIDPNNILVSIGQNLTGPSGSLIPYNVVREFTEPGKTIVVRRVGVTDPISYVLGKTVRYVNKAGKEIEASMIKPGAKVHVYYDGTDSTQVVSRVVVDE